MYGVDLAGLCREPERLGCDHEQFCRPAQVQIWLDPIRSGPEDWDSIMGPHGGNPLTCPAVAIAGDKTVPIEAAGDQIIVCDEHKLADGGDDICARAVALPLAPPRQAQLGMKLRPSNG